MIRLGDRAAVIAIILLLLALAAPLGPAGWWWTRPSAMICAVIAIAAGIWCLKARPSGLAAGLVVAAAVIIGAWPPLSLVAAETPGLGALGLWLYVIGLGFLAWRAMELLANTVTLSPTVDRLVALLVQRRIRPIHQPLAGSVRPASILGYREHDDDESSERASALVPAIFGLWLIYVWQVAVAGLGVPRVLLPTPSAIGEVMAGALDTMAADFHQTFIKSVIPGYLLGCGSGFLVAILVDRVPFLQRGLLPLGSFVSAIRSSASRQSWSCGSASTGNRRRWW